MNEKQTGDSNPFGDPAKIANWVTDAKTTGAILAALNSAGKAADALLTSSAIPDSKLDERFTH